MALLMAFLLIINGNILLFYKLLGSGYIEIQKATFTVKEGSVTSEKISKESRCSWLQ